MKQAEGTSDAASDRFDAVERALDQAREDRAQPGRTGRRTSGPAPPRIASPGGCPVAVVLATPCEAEEKVTVRAYLWPAHALGMGEPFRQ